MSSVKTDLMVQSRRLQRVASTACVILAFSLAMESFGPIVVEAAHGAPPGVVGHDVLIGGIAILPAIFYLIGLWHIRDALAALADGDLFAAAAANALDRVGKVLATGAFASVVLAPALSRLSGESPGYVFALDVGAVVLGVVGLALALFANLFRRAAKLQSQMSEII